MDQIEVQTYLCLYLHIYKRDPFTQAGMGNLDAYLESHFEHKIPRSTYFFRLKKGLEQLSHHLSSYLARQTILFEPVPVVYGFVGRKDELAHCREQLEKNDVVVIQGGGGVGKTTLAAQLIAQLPGTSKVPGNSPVCWLTVRAGLNNTATAVLHAWAAFLARHGYPHLWAFMRTTASEPRLFSDYFPLLKVGLDAVQPLFCLDNLEVFDEADKSFWSLLEVILEEPHTRLVLTSRRRLPLPGLGDYLLQQLRARL